MICTRPSARKWNTHVNPLLFVIKIWGFSLLINQRNGKRWSRANHRPILNALGRLLSDAPRVILTLLSCLATSRGIHNSMITLCTFWNRDPTQTNSKSGEICEKKITRVDIKPRALIGQSFISFLPTGECDDRWRALKAVPVTFYSKLVCFTS